MKNFRQSIKFWDNIFRLCLITLSTPFLSLNLYSIHLSSGISYSIIENFSIYAFKLRYERFLVIGFINGLGKNL